MTISNRYNLLKQLGEGGFGEVWLAEDTMTDTQVALKLYKVNNRGHNELVREYRLVAGLKHPNLLTASYVGRDDSQGVSFLELDYCRYGSLEDITGSITERELWHCIHDIAAGLQALAAHTVFDEQAGKEIAAPVVHQDIKPANILIRSRKENGEATYAIADFGISKMNISQKSGSTLFSSAGTLSFMAPERFRADYHPIVESDIWSLGAMLYELVEDKLPFASIEGLSGGNWLNQKGVEMPEITNTHITPLLRNLIYACMAKEPAQRPTAKQLRDTATAVLNGEKPKITFAQPENSRKVDPDATVSRIDPIQKPTPKPAPKPTPEPTPSPAPKPTPEPTPNPAPKPAPNPPNPHRKWLYIGIAAIVCIILLIARFLIWPTSDVSMDGNTLKFTVDGQDYSYQMVYVNGGTYNMGTQKTSSTSANYDPDAFDWESPVHSVTVSSFYMGQTEVTQALWKAVMGNNPSNREGNNLPVESVSYNDCIEFINKLNQLTGRTFRLPTEEEWEFAARGGNNSQGYKYSGSNDIGTVAWYDGNSGGKTHPVAQKQRNELGLYDMSGNVWEWCSSIWCNDYNSSRSGSDRVNRGGSWFNFARICRVSSRGSSTPSDRGSILGLRLVLVP